MKPKVKGISIYELKPSMILAEDLILNGLTLVAKEIALNNSMIKKILEFYPSNTIYIYADEEETAVSSSQTLRQQSLIETENVLNHFQIKSQNRCPFHCT